MIFTETAFGNDARMGLRCVAEQLEACDTVMVGGTHVVTWLTDYRTAENDAYFMPLIAGLGRYYIEELS